MSTITTDSGLQYEELVTGTGDEAGASVRIQSDGNLVEYDAHHHAVWSSR